MHKYYLQTYENIKWIILFILVYNLHFLLNIMHGFVGQELSLDPHPHGCLFPATLSALVEGSEGCGFA